VTQQPVVTEVNDLPGEKVGKNAALISGITMLARVAGFGRILVLTWAVGLGGVLDVYNTANRVPNILYEIAAGGALAALVVPLLAAPLARREPDVVNRTASGLLTWSLVVLVPIGLVVALLAEPIMRLLAGNADPAEIAMGTRMIQVFAPQLPLYGIGVVLTGILHTHRRFAWPALAPLLSSLTVIAAYLVYGFLAPNGAAAGDLSRGQELVLSVGTTLATVVMTFCLLIPMRKVGIRLRPTLRFGGGDVTRNVRTMAIAGGVSIAAWQLLILGLTNGGLTGTVGMFSIALTLYMLPWGVFAMPLALSSYPALSEAYGVGDLERYDTTLSVVTRRVLVLSCLGIAAMIGLAAPLASVFAEIGGTADVDPNLPVVPAMTAALIALAPGLLGFSLYPLLTRALYARGATVAAAVATVAGWVVAYLAAIGFSVWLPVADRAMAVGIGNTIGMIVLGGALLVTVASRAGRASLAGVWWAGLVGLISAAVSAAAGWWVAGLFGPELELLEAVAALAAGGVVILVVFAVVAFLIDHRDMRPMVGNAVARLTGRRNR
jgi:putative peptidoglycan lipid II flippase